MIKIDWKDAIYLNVVPQDFAMPLGTALTQALSSFAASSHDDRALVNDRYDMTVHCLWKLLQDQLLLEIYFFCAVSKLHLFMCVSCFINTSWINQSSVLNNVSIALTLLVNVLVLVCFGVSLTCPEVAVCVSGNAAAVYSCTINARCTQLGQQFYNMCITFV